MSQPPRRRRKLGKSKTEEGYGQGQAVIDFGDDVLLDEDAMVEALRGGQIAMAGLDVFRDEPLPSSSPLLSLPNVVLAPHTGGGSQRSRALDRPAALANILRFFHGEPVRGVINSD